ncbi:MlaD family protein [Marinobacter salicampi]|uniref:MlaD family protein n=1 Tax=Marinobacter salicampi TaxID=435907 RepID=UPI00140885ED|nr:MlaD family protein [Marinobacter salicampi]
MEPRANHILIGLFTVLTLAGGLLFALWLSKSSTDRDYAYYEIAFDRSVSGLAEGNAVEYSGIRVGEVLSLRLGSDDPREVRALIRVFSDVPIKKDTRASLSLANITGSMNIQLSGGTPGGPDLEGDRKNPPLIKAEPSPISSLLSSSEVLFSKVDQLLTNANRLFSEENGDRLARILGNVEKVSLMLAEQDEQFAGAITDFSRSAEQAEEAMAEFSRLGKQANAMLDKNGNDILTSAESAMNSLESATAQLERMLSAHEGSLDRGMQGLGEIAPVMRELRGTLNNLKRITQRLEANPGEFLLRREQLEEFTP